jgi:hypothetical protein
MNELNAGRIAVPRFDPEIEEFRRSEREHS